MDRNRLIKAISTMDRNDLVELIASTRERKTLYFFLGDNGSIELVWRDADRRFRWNLDGRVFDLRGNVHIYARLGHLKALKGTLSCIYPLDLPFNLHMPEDIKFAFRMDVVRVGNE